MGTYCTLAYPPVQVSRDSQEPKVIPGMVERTYCKLSYPPVLVSWDSKVPTVINSQDGPMNTLYTIAYLLVHVSWDSQVPRVIPRMVL